VKQQQQTLAAPQRVWQQVWRSSTQPLCRKRRGQQRGVQEPVSLGVPGGASSSSSSSMKRRGLQLVQQVAVLERHLLRKGAS
jgi:hypothetical protein